MSMSMTATHRYCRLTAIWLLVAFIWIPSRAYSIGFEIVQGSVKLDSFEFPSEVVNREGLQSGEVFSQYSPGHELAGYLNQHTGSGIFMISCTIRLPAFEPFGLQPIKTASTPTFFVSRQDQLLIVLDVSSARIQLPPSTSGDQPPPVRATAIYILAYSISRADMDKLFNGSPGDLVSGEVVDLGRERYDRLMRSRFLPLILRSYTTYRRIDPTAPQIPLSVFQRAESLFSENPDTEAQIYFPDANELVSTNAASLNQWRLVPGRMAR